MSSTESLKDHPLSLPFVKEKFKDTEFHFWSISSSGNYQQDYQLGELYAKKALCFIQRRRLPAVLNWIIRDMPNEFGAVELGFLNYITNKAVVGYQTG